MLGPEGLRRSLRLREGATVTELEPTKRYWVEGWNSHRALAVLNRENQDDLNHTVAFMAVTLKTAYGQLREAIESGEEATWLQPEITLHYELPFAMTSTGLYKIESQEDLWSCEMIAVLDLLSGLVVLEQNEEMTDFEPRFFDFGNRSPPTPDSTMKIPVFLARHSSIRGLDQQGNSVEIGLVVKLGPRHVIPHERRTFGTITVGLSVSSATDHLLPHYWSKNEESAFWDSVLGILEEVHSRAIGGRFRSERTEAVRGRPAAERHGIRRFIAKSIDRGGSDLFDRLSPPELSETPYARGAGPRLVILDHAGGLHELAIQQVFATMHFPGGGSAERTLRAACVARWEIQIAHKLFDRAIDEEPEMALHWPEFLYMLGTQGLLSPSSFRNIAPPPPDLDSELAIRNANGLVAGQLLLRVLACSIHHLEHASLGKAVFLFIEELKIENKTKPKNERINDNRTKILDSWSKMRSVAHLWAAASLVDEPGTKAFFKCPDGFLPRLLAIAEALRIHGEQHSAQRLNDKKGPILDPSSTWRPPDCLELPVVKLIPSRLPPEALEKLRHYRADRSRKK